MFVPTRRLIRFAALSAALALPRVSSAQGPEFRACTTTALETCAQVYLSQQLGVGPGGVNLFQIALQNLGSTTTPSLPSSLLLLWMTTSQTIVPVGSEVDSLVAPTPVGGATVTDNTAWNVYENGESIFLQAITNNGIGGCAGAEDPIGGVGLMGQTCGPNALMTFSFFTPRTFDLASVSLADIEWSSVAPGNPADSCVPSATCNVTATPEPSTMVLALTGLFGVAGVRIRRRARRGSLVSHEA